MISQSLREKLPVAILALILVISGSIMLSVSSQESAIMDELAHIPSGYSYDRFFDYRLNPEHPPLVKVLAALPLLTLGLKFPTDNAAWTTEVNGQWDAGYQFLYRYNGRLADTIIFTARIFPILITLLLVLLTYLWSKKLMGQWWALLPALFVGLSPNFLAHGHYVTTDMGAALGFFIGLWSYVSYLTSPSKKKFWAAGVLFGIAQLLKFSTVLLVPLYVFYMLVHWWVKSRDAHVPFFSKDSLAILWRYIKSLVGIFLVGYLVVWAVYAIFTINYPIQRQAADTNYILSSFGGGSQLAWQKCPPKGLGMRCLADIDVWMSSVPILRGLGHYMLGVLMVIQRSAGGNTSYFLGEIGGTGWWYYFPVIFLLKETIPALIVVGLGLAFALWRYRNHKRSHERRLLANYIELNFAEFAMISMIIFYWLYSMRSSLNIGFRHVLPTIPLILILAFGSIKKWYEGISVAGQSRQIIGKGLKAGLVVVLCGWFLAEVVMAYPYYLSYFNEVGGGIWNGHQYVTDSNYDWGQDLKRLASYVEQNHIDKIAIDYFGGGSALYYLGDKAVLWNSTMGSPADKGIKWLAVSINTIESATAKPYENYPINQAWTYSWLSNPHTPYARAGTSIFIYRLQ